MSWHHRTGFEVVENRRRAPKLQGYTKETPEQREPPILREELRYTRLRERAESLEHHVRYLTATGHVHRVVFGPAHLAPQPPFATSLRTLQTIAAAPPVLGPVREHLRLFAAYSELTGIALSDPWIGVGDDGSVGLDWTHDGRRLAVTFEVSGDVEFYAKDHDNEASGQVVGPAGHMQVVSWLLLGWLPGGGAEAR